MRTNFGQKVKVVFPYHFLGDFRMVLKNEKWYGFRLRCRGFSSPNRVNGRSRNGRVRYGTVRVTNSDALLYLPLSLD